MHFVTADCDWQTYPKLNEIVRQFALDREHRLTIIFFFEIDSLWGCTPMLLYIIPKLNVTSIVAISIYFLRIVQKMYFVFVLYSTSNQAIHLKLSRRWKIIKKKVHKFYQIRNLCSTHLNVDCSFNCLYICITSVPPKKILNSNMASLIHTKEMENKNWQNKI